jgi:GTP-binding protein Era
VEDNVKTRCGYAAVIGRPNVGKSTLLNHILGRKASIVTSKPQTTRNRVLAVHNVGDSQVIFLDTPGLHRPEGSLGRYMMEAAQGAISEADVCVWIIDASHPRRSGGLLREEISVAESLKDLKIPIIALINKVDRLKDKGLLLPIMEETSAINGIEEVIPICALNGDGVDLFMVALLERIPFSPKLFPDDMLSDRADRFFVSELVREALIDLTRQEIPYRTAVVIDRFVEESRRCVIHGTIHVEKKSQKGIIIGKGGSMIRDIGIRARAQAEKLLGCPVDLRLHVNVSPDWTKDARGLKEMGYE